MTQADTKVANVLKLAGVNQNKVALLLRVQYAASIQTIANILSLFWAFGTALDKSTCLGM